jgi:hypothetical protein
MVLTVLGLLATLFVWGEYRAAPDANLTNLIGCFAALLALFGWIVTAWVSIYNSRKQHSINVLFHSRMSEVYQSRVNVIVDAFPGGRSKITRSGLVPSTEADRAVTFLLNYYEFIAVGIWHGDLDEAIIRDCIRTQMLAMTTRCADIIDDSRKGDGSKSAEKAVVFQSLIWLRDRWTRDLWRRTGAWPDAAMPTVPGAMAPDLLSSK